MFFLRAALPLFFSLSLAAPATAFDLRPETDLTIAAAIDYGATREQRQLHDGWLEEGFGSLWMVLHPNLVRMDPQSLEVTVVAELPGVAGPIKQIIFSDDAVWVADVGTNTVYAVDVATGAVRMAHDVLLLDKDSTIATGDGSLWVVTAEGGQEKTLTRFDEDSLAVTAWIDLPEPAEGGVVFGAGSAWAVAIGAGTVFRIDPSSNRVIATIPVHNQPGVGAVAGGFVFVHSRDGWLDRIDSSSNAVISSVDLKAPGLEEFAIDGNRLWLITQLAIFEIDPTSGDVVNAYGPGSPKTLTWMPGIAAADGALWVLTRGFRQIVRLEPP